MYCFAITNCAPHQNRSNNLLSLENSVHITPLSCKTLYSLTLCGARIPYSFLYASEEEKNDNRNRTVWMINVCVCDKTI